MRLPEAVGIVLMLRQVRLTGVEGLVRIPRFASVGRHGHVVVSADRLAGRPRPRIQSNGSGCVQEVSSLPPPTSWPAAMMPQRSAVPSEFPRSRAL